MKKLIHLQENILKIDKYFIFIIFLITLILCKSIYSKETWIIDNNLSTVSFEVPVLLAKNVKGEFKKVEGIVQINPENKKSNKAIFSLMIDSIDMNYIKYKNLLFSEIFFDIKNYPLAVVEAIQFEYYNEDILNLNVEITIKGKSLTVPTKIKINKLAEELVQILAETEISRTEFNLGTGSWNNVSILKDNIKISTDLLLFKE